MKERPILFSGAMARKILAGEKTQTRRIVKDCKAFKCHDSPEHGDDTKPEDAYDVIVSKHQGGAAFLVAGDHGFTDFVPCPYGKPGDRLWVRETWTKDLRNVYPCATFSYAADYSKSELEELASGEHDRWCARRTDPNAIGSGECHSCGTHEAGVKWKPSIHMPRWASRITLEVTGVRVERLQAITEEDARAEGVDLSKPMPGTVNGKPATVAIFDHRKAFAVLWDAINGPGSWERSPWVWVVSFRRVQP
jgi:hypothetical protein